MRAVHLPLLMIIVLLLIAEAAAFIEPPSNDTPHCQTTALNNSDITNVQSLPSNINRAMISRLQELTEDTSKLEPIKQQYLMMEPSSLTQADNSEDTVLSPERLARDTLITTRLNIRLNRTRIGKSRIGGAGRGLFAIENIQKGEIITCYPGDVLLCEYSENDNLDDEDEEEYDEEWEFANEDPVQIIWGEHVNMKDRMGEDAVFDGIEEVSIPPLTSYSVNLDGVYSVIGLPGLDKDPAYYGHFANDGGYLLVAENGDDSKGMEENISAYVRESKHLSNAVHELLDRGFALGGLHIVTVATKDIKEGEEILVTYGPDYWLTT